jgi:hypothetical protein
MKVGTVKQIARYPVKSLRGEALDQVPVTLQGLEEDRRYAFVQADSRSAFPWFTARERARILMYGTRVERAGLPDSAVKVTSPGGIERPIDSPELLAELEALWGHRLYLLRDHRGCYDAAPVSLISTRTVERIAEESGTTPKPWRFRPNLLVDLPDGGEADWVGRILRVGATARIAITQRDGRCMMITLDPATAEAAPAVLRTVAQRHEGCAGVYGVVITAGPVRVGDAVSLEAQ